LPRCCARLPQERQITDLLGVTTTVTESGHMTHRHYGVPVPKPRLTYTGPTRAAAWSGGAIVGAIIASVIVLGFVVYEVSKIVAAAHDRPREPSTVEERGRRIP
jgi:hypothetical protein